MSAKSRALLHGWEERGQPGWSPGSGVLVWGLQKGCAETNIVSRMMELPLKLMTLLMVTISRSSTTSLGPLIGRDKTSVALTLLVCCRTEMKTVSETPPKNFYHVFHKNDTTHTIVNCNYLKKKSNNISIFLGNPQEGSLNLH